MRTKTKSSATREQYQSISFDRIILEITNFEGLEAESEVAWKKLLNRVDNGNKRYNQSAKFSKGTKSNTLNDKLSKLHKNIANENKEHDQLTNYKKLLANDDVIIIDKTPSKLRPTSQPHKEKLEDSNSLKELTKVIISNTEMPQPNTVRHFKDVYESLSSPPIQKDNSIPHKKGLHLGRSVSLPKNNERKQSFTTNSPLKMKTFSVENLYENNKIEENKKGLPTRLEFSEIGKEVQTEEEEKREWRNACSPVSPEVIEKIRKHGISMTFFGRPAYCYRSSPTMNSSIDEEWSMSRISDRSKKYSGKTVSSLCSSSTCSEDDYQYIWENTDTQCRNIFGEGYYYYSILNLHEENEDGGKNKEDSYDIIFLNETYSRNSTPKFGKMNKGIWLKDPYWHGSSYIIYDFRGTNVKPNISIK